MYDQVIGKYDDVDVVIISILNTKLNLNAKLKKSNQNPIIEVEKTKDILSYLGRMKNQSTINRLFSRNRQ